ncbi:neutral/alkaline non-lysosomal ceramidase N-terminal domain-containing protein [Microlunatus parietis]|nr:neutral/alkaline non-lysosomal ceramidase N-terminal domain-containing protein [Microlunatus parietis]
MEPLIWSPLAAAGRVGVAVRDITPPAGILARNWGAADTDVAAGVHRPLRATALAITDGAEPVRYLVSTDLGWWRNAAEEWAVRSRVLDALGAEPEDLLLHLVHTHSGPTLTATSPELEGADLVPAYFDLLAEKITEACREAAATAVEATATFGTARCDVAVDRALVAGGRDLVAFNPGAPADDTLLVGRITARDGRPLATMINYACHPTTLGWQPPLISPDWIGAARDEVEQAIGAPCLVLQGASGELSPREQYGDGELTDRVGRAIGYAALSGLTALPPPGSRLGLADVVESGTTLGIWRPQPVEPSRTLRTIRTVAELDARPEPTPEELARRHAGINPTAAAERLRRAGQLRAGYIDGDTAAHPLWVWRWGDAIVVAQAGEPYSWLQQELRRRHPDLAIFVLNCTNGPGFVYLPPVDVYRRDVYQVWQSEVVAGSLERVADLASVSILDLCR